jgi:hypothetical protein
MFDDAAVQAGQRAHEERLRAQEDRLRLWAQTPEQRAAEWDAKQRAYQEALEARRVKLAEDNVEGAWPELPAEWERVPAMAARRRALRARVMMPPSANAWREPPAFPDAPPEPAAFHLLDAHASASGAPLADDASCEGVARLEVARLARAAAGGLQVELRPPAAPAPAAARARLAVVREDLTALLPYLGSAPAPQLCAPPPLTEAEAVEVERLRGSLRLLW